MAKKASGARRRLELEGKFFDLRGPSITGKPINLRSFRGNLVLVHYWATWCEPCKTDLSALRDLQTKYARKKFSLVGVNLDQGESSQVRRFLNSNRLNWPQMHEPDGLEGRLAQEIGIFTLPVMILVDDQGKVIKHNIHVAELDAELKKRLR